MEKKYIIAINQAIVPAPYGMDSLYPGITLIQEKQERSFVEEYRYLDLALMFLKDQSSTVCLVENYQGTGSLHAVMKEYILFEKKNEDASQEECGVPLDAEAIGYSKLQK